MMSLKSAGTNLWAESERRERPGRLQLLQATLAAASTTHPASERTVGGPVALWVM